MSYSVQIGESGFEQLASNAGYADFAKWVESLDHKQYGQLVHLYEHGWCQDISTLEKQLADAVKSHKPSSASVISTIEGFQEILEGRDANAVVITVTDGIGEGDESSDQKSLRERLNKAGYADTEIVALVKDSDNHSPAADL